jgi:hypothetical protein
MSYTVKAKIERAGNDTVTEIVRGVRERDVETHRNHFRQAARPGESVTVTAYQTPTGR